MFIFRYRLQRFVKSNPKCKNQEQVPIVDCMSDSKLVRQRVGPTDLNIGTLGVLGVVWPEFCQFLSALGDVPRLRCCNLSLQNTTSVVLTLRMNDSYDLVDNGTHRVKRERLTRVGNLVTRMFVGEFVTTLVLAGCWYATDSCFEMIWPSLPNITTLDLGDCRSLTKTTIHSIADHNRKLQVLRYAHPQLTFMAATEPPLVDIAYAM